MKIAFVVKINFSSIISTTYHINILKFFSKHHKITILTNADSYLKKQGIDADYVHIPSFTFPNISRLLINDNITNLKLKNIDYDMLVIWYDSLIFFNQKKPVFRFVDICPYQTFERFIKGDKKRIKWNLFFKIYLKSFKKSSFILTISPQMKQFLIEYGISKEKVQWLPHGVDLERFKIKPETKKTKEFILISPVQFLPNRGSDLIIKSMEKLSALDKNIKFISLGNGDKEFKKWNSTIKDMKLDNHILLNGIVDNKEMPKHLSNAHVGVSVLEINEYYNKSPPQKIFEYMAMGLPTIANDIPTHTDYIKDGYNGFIINSAEDLVEAVLKLKNDQKLYKKISENAKESAKRYDIKIVEIKLKEYIDNIEKV